MTTGYYFDSNRTITENFEIEEPIGHHVFLAVLLIKQTEMLQ